MSLYGDTDELKRALSLTTTDTGMDDDLDRALFSASDGIDEAVGRSFGKGEEGEERLYEAGDAWISRMLAIDDLVELTSLTVDRTGEGTFETWVLDTDFRLGPLNAPGDERPWTSVRTLSGQGFPSHTDALVKVTGTFGWPSVPSQIVQATMLLAAQLFQRTRSAPFGVITAGADVGAVAYIARRDPHISGLIQPFSRRAVFGSVALT
jgi:hypothetical protein